jgi:hypothetical protein
MLRTCYVTGWLPTDESKDVLLSLMAPVHPVVLPSLPVLPCDLGTLHLPAEGQLWGVPLGAAVDVEVVGIVVDTSSQVGVGFLCAPTSDSVFNMSLLHIDCV